MMKTGESINGAGVTGGFRQSVVFGPKNHGGIVRAPATGAVTVFGGPNPGVSPVAASTDVESNILCTTEAMKLSDGAKRAHEFLRRKSEGKGIISSDGHRRDPAPVGHHGGMFEFRFDRPANCVNIPRDLFPISGTKEAIRKSAIRHSASNKEEDVDDMAAFITEVRLAVRSKIKACVRLRHTQDIREAQIPYNGRTATSKEEVFKAWTSCNPDAEIIQKLHNLLYCTFPPSTIDFITYETYLHYGLWLDKDADGALLTHKQAGDNKAKKCSIRSLVVVVAREYVRGRYSRKTDIPHGLILTISKDDERADLKRRKVNALFDFRRFVKGWKSQMHIRYCADRHYDIPSIPELESDDTSAVGSNNDNRNGAATVAHMFGQQSHGGAKDPSSTRPQRAETLVATNLDALADQNRIGLPASTGAGQCRQREAPTCAGGYTLHQATPVLAEQCRQTPAPTPITNFDPSFETVRLKRKLAEMQRNQNSMQRDILRQQAELNDRNDSSTREQVVLVAKQKTVTQPSQKRGPKKVSTGWDALELRKHNLSIEFVKCSTWNYKSRAGKENDPTNSATPTGNATRVCKGADKKSPSSRIQTQKLPAEEAPEDDHVEINEILDVRRSSGKGWECRYRMESQSGKYEDLVGWTPLAAAFSDLEPEEDSQGLEERAEENLLVLYITANKMKSLKPAAKIIADLRKVDLLELFPFYAEEQKSLKSTPLLEEIPTECDLCNHSDISLVSYSIVDCRYFFAEGRKYSESRCHLCKGWFQTDANKEEGRVGKIALPTMGVPAYICSGFEKDFCACGAVVCHDCFFSNQSNEPKKTRRNRRG